MNSDRRICIEGKSDSVNSELASTARDVVIKGNFFQN